MSDENKTSDTGAKPQPQPLPKPDPTLSMDVKGGETHSERPGTIRLVETNNNG